MQCEMCGKEVFSLKRALIEGVELNVCPKCAKYGKIIPKKKQKKPLSEEKKKEIVRKVFHLEEMDSKKTIVDNYAQIIRGARQKQGLEQKGLAVKIAEKESVIHAIETEKHQPSIKLAKKLENTLNIKLIEELDDSQDEESKKILQGFKKNKSKSNKLTLGDIITIRKR